MPIPAHAVPYSLTLYIFPFTFSLYSHFYSLSYLSCVSHMSYDHASHTSYFSTTSAEHNLYKAVCMNILTEAVKVTELQELHYLTSFTLIIINNLYPLLAQPTVIQKQKTMAINIAEQIKQECLHFKPVVYTQTHTHIIIIIRTIIFK